MRSIDQHWTSVHRVIPIGQHCSTIWRIVLNPGLRRWRLQQTWTSLSPFAKLYWTSIQGHHDHADSIDKLLLLVRMRIQRHGIPADLDECISLGRSALASCQPVNPRRAPCLHSRFHFTSRVEALPHWSSRSCNVFYHSRCFPSAQVPATGSDLDEAITLCQEALEVCPSGGVASVPHLHKLAWCLSERFTKLVMLTDVDDAIKYEQAALVLRPLGHPDRPESLSSLANYCQLRIKRSTIPRPDFPPVPTNSLSIEQLIRGAALDVLKALPAYLTPTMARYVTETLRSCISKTARSTNNWSCQPPHSTPPSEQVISTQSYLPTSDMLHCLIGGVHSNQCCVTFMGESFMTWIPLMVFRSYSPSVWHVVVMDTCGLGVIHAALTRRAVQNSKRQ